MKVMEKYKLLPYGISNYAQIKREGKYMVDKTKYLELMERAGNFLFFIRPRRFGKSLFLSMMNRITTSRQMTSSTSCLEIHTLGVTLRQSGMNTKFLDLTSLSQATLTNCVRMSMDI